MTVKDYYCHLKYSNAFLFNIFQTQCAEFTKENTFLLAFNLQIQSGREIKSCSQKILSWDFTYSTANVL